jgi:hypothetical protein
LAEGRRLRKSKQREPVESHEKAEEKDLDSSGLSAVNSARMKIQQNVVALFK